MTTHERKCSPSKSSSYLLDSFLLAPCLLVWLLVTSLAAAQETAAPKGISDAEHVLPFLRPTTCLIVKVDSAAIDVDQLISNVGTITPAAKDAYGDALRTLGASIQQLRELVDGQPVFSTIGIPVSKSRVSMHVFVRKTSAEKTDKLSAFLTNQVKAEVSTTGNYIVATLKGLRDEQPLLPADSNRDKIAAAFQSLEGYAAQVLFVPPEYLWRTVRELSPQLPPRLGGGSSQVLTDVQWLALGIDPGKLRTAIVIESASESAARELAARLPVILKSACDAVPKTENPLAMKVARTIIDSMKSQLAGSRVTIRFDGQEKTQDNLALLAGIAKAIEDTTRGLSNQQRLKQILLGIHNYYDANRSFPPADRYRGADKKHHLSWRVHILPYVDAAALYQEFRLEEPWDSPHNKPLIAKMPDVYASRGITKPGHTTFLAPVGDKTIFGQAKSTEFQDITDGSSNTITVVEVAPDRAVLWTAPDDFAFDPKNPLSGIRRGTDGKWLAAFADGSVQLIPGTIAAQTALDLFQMNDGHSINFNGWR